VPHFTPSRVMPRTRLEVSESERSLSYEANGPGITRPRSAVVIGYLVWPQVDSKEDLHDGSAASTPPATRMEWRGLSCTVGTRAPWPAGPILCSVAALLHRLAALSCLLSEPPAHLAEWNSCTSIQSLPIFLGPFARLRIKLAIV
jgi:hypothetical protein